MKNRALVLFVLSWALVSASEALQRGTGRVTGTVTDTEGNPIAGAHIVATAEGIGFQLEATSDENGNWGAVGFRNGNWTFTTTAEGYAPAAPTMAVKELARNPSLDIRLEKAAGAGLAVSEQAGEQLTAANELYGQGNYDQALALYQQIIEENPSIYRVHVNIGNVYKQQGDLDGALAEYQMVLDQEPSNGPALISIGDVLVQQGKLEEAAPYFEQAIDVSPGDETVPYKVAELCFSSGNVEKAVEFYQKAAAIKPDWASPYLKTGYAYLNMGKLDEAAVQFEKVVEVAPESPEAQQAQAALNSLGK